MTDSKRRVVITGVGVVTPLGCDKETFWGNLLQGKSGVGELSKLDPGPYQNTRSAEVSGFEELPEASDPALEEQGMAVSYSCAAARMCLEDAGLEKQVSGKNIGVVIGTTMGNQDVAERVIDQFDVKPGDTLNDEAAHKLTGFRPSELSLQVSRRFNLTGPTMVFPTACAAGNYALGAASSLVRSGRAKQVIAGGADPFSRTCYTIFQRLGASTPDVCRPFGADRTGIVVGEGAAMLMIEDREHAIARGARIYAEVTGYALTSDAHHRTAPHPEGRGAVQAMHQALSNAGLSASDVDFVSAHGTGTQANDSCEAIAMAEVFGRKLRDVPVNSIKSMLGHCMGAASAIENVACALSIHSGWIPPTISTTELDPSFPEPVNLVTGKPKETRVNHVMNNAFAFGGCVSSVILSAHR